jgi:hypothetical protein
MNRLNLTIRIGASNRLVLEASGIQGDEQRESFESVVLQKAEFHGLTLRHSSRSGIVSAFEYPEATVTALALTHAADVAELLNLPFTDLLPGCTC